MQRGMHACMVGSVFVDGQAKTIKRTGGVQLDDRCTCVVRMADHAWQGRCRGVKERTDGGSLTEMCNVHGHKRIPATMDGHTASIVLQNKAQRVTNTLLVANH